MGITKIQKQLNTYIGRVKDVFEPTKIILFGSYARGEATKDSDVDLIIISDKFKQVKPYSRFKKLYSLGKDLKTEFHTYGFTTKEIESKGEYPTLRSAIEMGIEIKI